MFFDPSLIPIYGLIACIIVLLVWTVFLHWKMRKFLSGKNGKSLEDSIVYALDDLKKIHTFEKEAITCLEDMEKRLRRSVQAVETMRFNPFKGTGDGGNQSFSTAFVSEEGRGVILSSLYSRDRISIFSKPLQDFESTFELTEEEKDVLKEAREKMK